MTKIPTDFIWSYSSLSAYQKCPFSFHQNYVLRNKKELPSTFFGSAMHKYAEMYALGLKPEADVIFTKHKCQPLDKSEFTFCTEQIRNFIDREVSPYRYLVETKDIYKIGNFLFTSVYDLLIMRGEELHNWDYKSSRDSSYIDDYENQWKLYTISLQKKYPTKKIKTFFYFPKSNERIEKTVSNPDEKYFSNCVERILLDETFKATPHKFCKWCGYKEKECPIYSR